MCVCTKGNFSAHRCTEIDTSDFDAVSNQLISYSSNLAVRLPRYDSGMEYDFGYRSKFSSVPT